ncbi:LacI family DNA-binding transcriptional regulator [Candidatus Enterococcus ferrettii]|uniref:LacI family transcriptional regulator n=1 Tax=Candidatus Enterococcus ferrettii TaxID=2815324 RepID=A0ABV0EU44_9ENTE|nr:LacI family DNA-binding transcriptional regulator [Enterococcus sp. 665A]MBO1339531.1 LacI family DNA-binding transcriptional regulator [Enterococcus sp. 665A]
MVGIRDVAKKAGVSPGTVSRVLNADASLTVTKETRQKIMAAVEFYGYEKKERSKRVVATIGIVTSVTKINEWDDPYFRNIRIGMEKEAKRAHLRIENVYRLPQNPKLEGIDKLGAVLVIGQVEEHLLEEIYSKNRNVVIIDDAKVSKKFDTVYSDLEEATESHLDRIYQKGHRNIAFIGGFRRIRSNNGSEIIKYDDIRHLTYLNWMKRQQLGEYSAAFVGDWTTIEGMRLGQEFIAAYRNKELPTAIVVGSDPMAVGVYRALQEKNIRIPEDISIVSYDNIEVAEFLMPSLSTINIETEEIGSLSVRMAAEKIEGVRCAPVRINVPGTIIVRESEQVRN